jgi:hypothetical protein
MHARIDGAKTFGKYLADAAPILIGNIIAGSPSWRPSRTLNKSRASGTKWPNDKA